MAPDASKRRQYVSGVTIRTRKAAPPRPAATGNRHYYLFIIGGLGKWRGGAGGLSPATAARPSQARCSPCVALTAKAAAVAVSILALCPVTPCAAASRREPWRYVSWAGGTAKATYLGSRAAAVAVGGALRLAKARQGLRSPAWAARPPELERIGALLHCCTTPTPDLLSRPAWAQGVQSCPFDSFDSVTPTHPKLY